MSTHTPGPWTCRVLNSDDTVAVIRAGTLQIAAIGYAPGFAEEANARLIAAAPDLLAALRLVWNSIDDRVNHPAAVAVSAAIAKAEGKQ